MSDANDMASYVQDILPPFARQLGVKIRTATPDKLVGELLVREELATTPATLHGGAFMAFADTLGACTALLNLKEGQGTTTLESKTNFFAPAPVGTTVTGESVPLHRGRRTMVFQTRITSESGKLLAVVTQTQMVLEPAPGK